MNRGDEQGIDEDDDEVEKINALVIIQCGERGLVKVETSYGHSDDVRIKALEKFISYNKFIKTSKLKSFVYKNKRNLLRQRMSKITLK
jgi:hypothetical protein